MKSRRGKWKRKKMEAGAKNIRRGKWRGKTNGGSGISGGDGNALEMDVR